MAINRTASLALPTSMGFLIDDIISKRNGSLLGPLMAIVGCAILLQAVTSFAITHVVSKAGQRLITELRIRLQEHVTFLPVAYHDSHRTGSLVARIMSDVEGLRHFVGAGLVELAGALLTATVSLVAMLYISPSLTAVTLAGLVLLVIPLAHSGANLRTVYRERAQVSAEVMGRLFEALGAIRVIKGFDAEGRESQSFASGAGRLLANALRGLDLRSSLGFTSTLVVGLLGIVTMYLGGTQILNGTLSIGAFFAYTALLGLLVAPVSHLVALGAELGEAVGALEKTREILIERREADDPRRTAWLGPLKGAIAFENVTFAYNANRSALTNISFRAEPGMVTALVGPSGAGKSTTISLIAAFYRPTTGRILVDGTDISTLSLTSYRSQIGVVFQDTFLFDGTIRDNVAFARPDASDDQLLTACRIAQVDEFALRFADRYDTMVGEKGVMLSSGQRQRISIARAILADPRILLLDEATASLDAESEDLIQRSIASLLRGRTTFIVAHRLSTIQGADQILVFQGGQIVEHGSHASLLALGRRYYEMYLRHTGDDVLSRRSLVNPTSTSSGESGPKDDVGPRGPSHTHRL